MKKIVLVSIFLGVLLTSALFASGLIDRLAEVIILKRSVVDAVSGALDSQEVREVVELDATSAETALATAPLASPSASPLAALPLSASPSSAPAPSASPSAVPAPRVVGPGCARVPTLMYHHVEEMELAKAAGYASLTVDLQQFREQMQYLQEKGYAVISMQQLNAFFDSGAALPSKPVLITFDDGYEDFLKAAAVMNEFSFPATLFLATGLAENPGYLSWEQVKGLDPRFLVANHTWSHKNMQSSRSVIEQEISLADGQLAERSLNQPKVFAYPYGLQSATAVNVLTAQNYTLAFTTQPGSVLCADERLLLPRIRVGNSRLSAYGL